MYKGIDVSEHNGRIDWEKVKPQIDFAMLRAGYGRGHIDEYFRRNATACEKYGIPYGVYWFSYAFDTDLAFEEANHVCNLIKDYKPTMPICFDYEYESYNWGKKQYAMLDYDDVAAIADTFLDHVESRGYYAMVYTNMDWYNNCFYKLKNRYDTWLAFWGTEEPKRKYGIHQYSSTGRIAGIDGNVDLNKTEYNYPSIIANMNIQHEVSKLNVNEANIRDIVANLTSDFWETYMDIAYRYGKGYYGEGAEALSLIRSEGYDSDLVRAIVGVMRKGRKL